MTTPGSSARAKTPTSTLSPEQLSGIAVVSFDLDDTLWDCDPVIEQAERVLYEVMQRETPRITQALDLDAVRARRMEFAQAHPEYRVDVTYLRTASLRALLSEYAYPVSLADELFQCFYRARSEVELYAEALPVLQALASRYHLAALTNGNADLALIGIDHHFADIQRASLDNPPKPAVAMFEKTAQRLGIAVDQILHVGDNPTTDVGGAHNAGALSVWFNQHDDIWPEEQPSPHVEIAKLSDLVTLLNIEQP